jgi:hypothetical protein
MYCRLINTFGLCIHGRVIPENLRITGTIRVGTGRVMPKAKRSWRGLVGCRTRACAVLSDPHDLVVAVPVPSTRHTSFAFVTRLATASFFSSRPPSPLALLLLRRLQVPVRLASKHADVIRLCRLHNKCAPPPLRLPVTLCHAHRARHLASRPSLVSRPSLDTHLTVYRTI